MRSERTKTHWLNLYLEKLNSDEGMSVEEIEQLEIERRKAEGLQPIKLATVERALNTFGLPQKGTKKIYDEMEAVGGMLLRLRKEIEAAEIKLEKIGITPTEREFFWLFIEGYSMREIAEIIDIDETTLEEIREKFYI